MKISFENIKIHNFLSLSDAEIKLDNRGYVLISGINNNPADNAKSNGSGKSSIAEAIVWALTGDTFRGIKNVVNMFADGGTYVDITFKANGKNYRIVRYKEYEKLGNNLKFYVNGEDKSGKGIRDTDDIISNYLPELTTQLIGSIIILGQGLPLRFSNNTPSGRKDVLEKLSKSDFMIEDIKNKLNDRKLYLNNKLRELEDKNLTQTTELKLLNNQVESTQKSLESLPNSNELVIQFESLTGELDELNITRDDYDISIEDFEQNLNLLNNQIEDINSNSTQLHNTIYNKYTFQIDDFNSKISELNSQIRYLKTEINRLDSITDTCPTCHQKLPDVIKPDTTEQKHHLQQLDEQLNYYQNQLLTLKSQLDEELKLNDENNKQSLIELKAKRESLNIAKNQLNQQLTAINRDITSKTTAINKIQLQIDTLDSKKSELESQLVNTKQLIEELNQKLLYNKSEQDNLNNHISIINKMFTLATRDFRGQLLSSVIDFIDKKTKEYAKHVFNTDNISFVLEGNAINISYDNKQLESLSGGERQKVDLIIQFALRDMMCQYLNFTSNILFVDECFDNLDVTGCQKIIDLIAENVCDVESIFIITHHSSELAIPYDDEIVIVKNPSGVSYIQ